MTNVEAGRAMDCGAILREAFDGRGEEFPGSSSWGRGYRIRLPGVLMPLGWRSRGWC